MSRHPGFSLLEVLVALALAALVLGVLIRTAGAESLEIGRATSRYQALVTASGLLEAAAEERFGGEESGEEGPVGYRLETRTMPVDPRLEELRVEVEGERGVRLVLRAYRLRARHREEPLSSDAALPGQGAPPFGGASP